MTVEQFADLAEAYKPLGEKACKIMEERFERNPPDDYAGGIVIYHPGQVHDNAISVNVNYDSTRGRRQYSEYHVHFTDLMK